MTDTTNQSQYSIGDAVLVDFAGAGIPGVIEASEGGRYLVRLSQPWADETGSKTDTVWVESNRISGFINQETGGGQAVPSP
jgi:hypothetical protein